MKTQLIKANLRFAFILLSVLFGIGTARAETITVTNTNFNGLCSLPQAIFDAVPGDTINFNLSGCPCVISFAGELLTNKN